jgi:phosphoadenosine phosphosulfate reductase
MNTALFDARELPGFWRLGATSQDHAQALGELLALEDGATVVHMGLGGDELAALLPGLKWCDGQDLEPGAAAAVVLAYAMGSAPVDQLRQARQLLAPGGTLVLQDLFAHDRSSQAAARQLLGQELHDMQAVQLWAELEGFSLAVVLDELHRAPGARLDAAMPVLGQLGHSTTVWRKVREAGALDGAAALQFSGGKDSLACLLLCLPYVQAGLPVYWCSTGDNLPETLEVVRWASERVPDFRVVQSDVKAWRAKFGMPSDVLPADCSPMGMLNGLGTVAMTGRFDCCWFNLMAPMHARMLADGIQTVVRGTKLADTPKAPSRDDVSYGVVLPVDGWSHDQVLGYLDRWAEFKNRVYEVARMESAPECLGCTAWWGDGKAQYFKARQPEQLGRYVVSLQSMRQELQQRMQLLDAEIKECEQ